MYSFHKYRSPLIKQIFPYVSLYQKNGTFSNLSATSKTGADTGFAADFMRFTTPSQKFLKKAVEKPSEKCYNGITALKEEKNALEQKLRIAICEDLKKDRDRLLSLIREAGFAAKCDTFVSGEAFLARFRKGMYHLIYLDIYMNDINGMETAAYIRERDEGVLLAFTTTSREHAFEANKFRSLLYIEKPVTLDMIKHTLMLASALRQKQQSEVLTVFSEAVQVDIPHTEIIYIEVIDQRCVIHIEGGKTIAASTTLNINDIEESLPKPRFCRSHRSFIVNMDKVRRVNGKDFEMKDGSIAYITQRDRRRIMNLYDEWLFGSVMGETI
jgi:DNA-binding LytR/AlgR family response regulator